MKRLTKAGVFLLITLAAAGVQAKTTASDVLAQIEKNYKGIRDYKVNVEITVDSPQMKLPASKAVIYFKQPDKVKFEAKEGFALLPKEAFPGNPVKAIKEGFKTTYIGTEKVKGKPAHVLKLKTKTIENQGTIKLWVEKKRGLIIATEAENQGTKLRSEWSYTKVDNKYWLPSKIDAVMTGVLAAQTFDPDEAKVKPAQTGKGTVKVKFSGYRVNKGVSDKVFVEKKKSKK